MNLLIHGLAAIILGLGTLLGIASPFGQSAEGKRIRLIIGLVWLSLIVNASFLIRGGFKAFQPMGALPKASLWAAMAVSLVLLLVYALLAWEIWLSRRKKRDFPPASDKAEEDAE